MGTLIPRRVELLAGVGNFKRCQGLEFWFRKPDYLS